MVSDLIYRSLFLSSLSPLSFGPQLCLSMFILILSSPLLRFHQIVKRRVPVPFVEFEQRTLKFTLSKSRKKDDFGIVLGCKFFIKEILNPKLAEKEPGLKEGDTVLRVNGQGLDGMTLDEASRMLQRSREKLSLVVQRDVRRGAGGPGAPGGGGRWPSQTTVSGGGGGEGGSRVIGKRK